MLTFIKNKLGQVSLITTKQIKKGQMIFPLDLGEFFNQPNLRTIELSPDLHIDHPFGRYTNHSCNPTCYIDKTKKEMRAARDISPGEEITFDYTLNETNMSTSFECVCESFNCKGLISGSTSIPTHLNKV